MPRYVAVPIDPTVAVSTYNGDPAEIDDPVIVGDPAGALSDDSDTTYAEVPATDEVFASAVSGRLEPRPVTRDLNAGPIKVRLRVKGPAASRVSVTTDIVGEGSFSGSTPGAPPATPTWVEYGLTENVPTFTQRPMILLLDYLNGERTDYAVTLTVHTSGGPENARLYVYEAQLLVPGPPSAPGGVRKFPAIHGTSVGGIVRKFPPTKFSDRGHAGRHG